MKRSESAYGLLETTSSEYPSPSSLATLSSTQPASDSQQQQRNSSSPKWGREGLPTGSGIHRSASFQAALNDPHLNKSLKDATPKRSYNDPNSPSSGAKIRFEKLVRRYYYQLTVGCGDATCTHKLCASCKMGPRLTPDASAIMAVQLASRPRQFFCPRVPPEPQISLGDSLFVPPGVGGGPKMGRRGETEAGGDGLARDGGDRYGGMPTGAGVSAPLPSRPFLYSLLSSSPFASLFSPSGPEREHKRDQASGPAASDPMTPGREGSEDFAGSDEPISATERVGMDSPQAIPVSPVVANGDAGPVGLGLLSKFAGEGMSPDKLTVRSRSFMDLPSLFSASVSFLKGTGSQVDSGASTPARGMSPSSSVSSLNGLDVESVSSGIARSGSPLKYGTGSKSNGNPGESLPSSMDSTNESDGEEEPQLSLRYLTLPLLKLAVRTYQVTGDDAEKFSDGSGSTADSEGEGLVVGSHRVRSLGATGDPHFLLSTLRTIFSSSEALNQSFLTVDGADGHPSGLDIISIRESYDLILALSPRDKFITTFANAIEILLAKLHLNLKHLQTGSPKVLRQIMILLERTYHESLLKKLCLVVGGLRSKSRNVLIKWLSAYDATGFANIVATFQQYLTDHFYPSPRPDEALVSAIKVLSMLYHANELSRPHLLPISSFYNETLSRKLNFKDEYRTWKRTLDSSIERITDFSYFNYPFLFDPVAKTRIMHIDAMVQMSLEFEDAFVHQALVIHAQRFLQDSPSAERLEGEFRRQTNPFLLLEIRRERFVDDVLDQIRKKEADLKKPLKVKFVGGGEEGMDQGGVQKEFFQVLVGMLLDPAYGMFSHDEETRFCWFNGASLEPERQFELVGIILGLALYNGVMVGVNFPRLVWKKVLDETPDLDDLKEAFPALGRGLEQLLTWEDGDVADIFLRTFEISYDVYGQVKSFPLVDGGEDILVTNANRKEYVDLYVRHFTVDSVKRQFGAFKRGFWKMCRSYELDLMVCGTTSTNLDFAALEEGAQYDDGYSPDHYEIRWFWEIVHGMELEQKKKLLEFVTASDRVPAKGLGALVFVVQRNGPDSDRLPTALTCFGRLLLPEYASKEKLQDRLVTAIENAKGFGLV
ncbi:hypothetical protein HK104_001276 [Borealophlyctis nickersoniae]|nr:hypothetical protein HK104_001276 [Borealophlyctis nickersoniae]